MFDALQQKDSPAPRPDWALDVFADYFTLMALAQQASDRRLASDLSGGPDERNRNQIKLADFAANQTRQAETPG
jgi:hypothetical protein